jgi:hypothetical protein
MIRGAGSVMVTIVFVGLISFSAVFGQESAGKVLNPGIDIYSSYIWRGSKYGTGPAIQPVIEFTAGSFTAGAWGSFDFRGYQETDLYFVFSLPAGFSLGMTDYYSPDLRYFDYSEKSGSHAYEINVNFSRGNFSLGSNYILNKAGGIGSSGGDKYFEASYSLKSIILFIGAGDGWHTKESDTGRKRFAVCNIGLGTTKQIKITESFSLPVNAQLVLNPDSEQLFIVAGFSF